MASTKPISSARAAETFSAATNSSSALPLPDQARQPLRASPTSDQSESGAAMSEDRVGRGDPAMACQSEVEASAHAMAFDGCNHGRGIRGDRLHQGLPHGGECIGFGAGERGDLVEVGSDGEVVLAGNRQGRCWRLRRSQLSNLFRERDYFLGESDGSCRLRKPALEKKLRRHDLM